MDLTVVYQALVLASYVCHLEQFLLLRVMVLLNANIIFIVLFAWSKASSLCCIHSRLLLKHLVREECVRSVVLERGRRFARPVCHFMSNDEA